MGIVSESMRQAAASRVRRPAVAGYFYPAEPAELAHAIATLTRGATPASRAMAALVPHGSFRHAGHVIGPTLASIRIPRRCLILGPSHTGSWMPWSVMASGAYRTPLGEVPIDADCVDALRQRCPFLEADAWAQRGEHAIEVVLPFLQHLGPPDLAIVPLVMGPVAREEIARLAVAIAQVVRMLEEPALVLASADLSHYLPHEQAVQQDRALLQAVCALRPAGMRGAVERAGLHLCGEDALACALEAARALGASGGAVVRYGTSAQAGGDPHSAIGYAGVVMR